MTGWEPATEAEIAMRDALRAGDQEQYFRVLSRTRLLLPVSADALAGRAPMGWGTWTTGGRTHVLAFTSAEALRACLAEHAGSARELSYHELAASWPNLEWWLAVNPGLPVEGYLPAWFVAQLARGDVRLPSRQSADDASSEAASGRPQSGVPQSGVPQPGPQPAAPQSVPPHAGAAQSGPLTAPAAAGYGAVPAAAPTPPAPPMSTGPAAPPPAPSPAQPPMAQPAQPAPAPTASGLPRRPTGQPASGFGAPANPPPYGSAGYDTPTSPPPYGAQATPSPYGAPAAPPAYGAPAGPATPAAYGAPTAPPDYGVPAGPATPAAYGAPATPPSYAAPAAPGAAQPAYAPVSPPPAAPVSAGPGVSGLNPSGPGGSGPGGSGPGLAGPGQPAAPEGLPRRPGPAPAEGLPRRPGGAPESLPRRPGTSPRIDPEPGFSGFTPAGSGGTAGQGSGGYGAGGPGNGGPGNGGYGATGPGSGGYGAGEPDPGGYGAAGYGQPGPGRAEQVRAFDPVQAATAPPFPGTVAPAPAPPQPPAAVPAPAPLPTVPPAAFEAGVVGAPPLADPGSAGPSMFDTDSVASAAPGGHPSSGDPSFAPANEVEAALLAAARTGSTDSFLSTLLLAKVLVPIPAEASRTARPGDPDFAWRTERIDGGRYVVVFTSMERLGEHFPEPTITTSVKFIQLIRAWPDSTWSFAVNPGTPVGATLPGAQLLALANWAAEVGLGTETDADEPAQAAPEEPSQRVHRPAPEDPSRPTVMQKVVQPDQVDYYLERGYDRVSGFVHRAAEVAHLRTPAKLVAALGLRYTGSPFNADAQAMYVLRWPAYRPSLYRIPYGGQTEPAMRAMEGWVIERPPFRGNGFAPGDSSEVVAEFKVDSARLPHGAQLWRVSADGTETLVATLDADRPVWRRVGED